MQHAVYHNLIPNNPVNLDRLSLDENNRNVRGKSKEILFYTQDELKTFIQKLKETNDISKIASFLILINLGLRKGELFALKWVNIDFTNKKIRIFQSISLDENNKPYIKGTKNNVERTLDIDDDTFQALLNWRELQLVQLKSLNIKHLKDEQLIFPNKNNTFYNNSVLNTWLKKFQKKQQLKTVTIHGLRHTCATIKYYQSNDFKYIQYFLGHTSLKTTIDTYIHCIPELSSFLSTSNK